MLRYPSPSSSPCIIISPLAAARVLATPAPRLSQLRRQAVLCLQLVTLLWVLLFRRPARAALAVLGCLMEPGPGAADAVDVVLSIEF